MKDADQIALQTLFDVYKHHWDLFLKAFAFYLLASSILIGYALTDSADIYTEMFAGIATSVASAVAFYAIGLSLNFVQDSRLKAEAIASRMSIEIIDIGTTEELLKIFRITSVTIGSGGILFAIHALLIHFGLGLI